MFVKVSRIAAMLCVGLAVVALAPRAFAGALSSEINTYSKVGGGNVTMFEDEDRSVFLVEGTSSTGAKTWTKITDLSNLQVGDVALGWFTIDFLEVGSGTVPPNSIVAVGPYSGSDNGSLNSITVEGLLHAEVASISVSSGVYTIYLRNRSSSTTYDGVTVSGFDGITQIFRDDSPASFTADDASDALPEVSDGTALGVLADGDGSSTGEFYKLVLDTSSGLGTFQFSMNFLSAPLDMPRIVKNDLGTDVYGAGSLEPVTSSDFLSRSQGNYKVLFVPVPSAAWMGLLMMVGLAFGRKMRRSRG